MFVEKVLAHVSARGGAAPGIDGPSVAAVATDAGVVGEVGASTVSSEAAPTKITVALAAEPASVSATEPAAEPGHRMAESGAAAEGEPVQWTTVEEVLKLPDWCLADLSLLPLEALSRVSARQVASLPPAALRSLNADQLSALPDHAVGALSGSQVSALPAAAFAGLQPSQAACLGAEAMEAVSDEQACNMVDAVAVAIEEAAQTPRSASSHRARSSSGSGIAAVPAALFAALSASQVASLPEEGIAGLTIQETFSRRARSLSTPSVVSRVLDAVITEAELSSLPAVIFAALTMEHIQRMPKRAVSGLSAEQVAAIPEEALRNLSLVQADALQPQAAAALSTRQMECLQPAVGGLIIRKVLLYAIGRVRAVSEPTCAGACEASPSISAEGGDGPTENDAIQWTTADGMLPLPDWCMLDLSLLPHELLSHMNAQQIAELPEVALRSLGPDQLAALPGDAIAALTASQINALAPNAFSGLQPAQAVRLGVDAMLAASDEQLEQLSDLAVVALEVMAMTPDTTPRPTPLAALNVAATMSSARSSHSPGGSVRSSERATLPGQENVGNIAGNKCTGTQGRQPPAVARGLSFGAWVSDADDNAPDPSPEYPCLVQGDGDYSEVAQTPSFSRGYRSRLDSSAAALASGRSRHTPDAEVGSGIPAGALARIASPPTKRAVRMRLRPLIERFAQKMAQREARDLRLARWHGRQARLQAPAAHWNGVWYPPGPGPHSTTPINPGVWIPPPSPEA